MVQVGVVLACVHLFPWNKRDLKCNLNIKGDSDILVGNDKRKMGKNNICTRTSTPAETLVSLTCENIWSIQLWQSCFNIMGNLNRQADWITGNKRLVVICMVKQMKDADPGRLMHKGSRSWTVHLFPRFSQGRHSAYSTSNRWEPSTWSDGWLTERRGPGKC